MHLPNRLSTQTFLEALSGKFNYPYFKGVRYGDNGECVIDGRYSAYAITIYDNDTATLSADFNVPSNMKRFVMLEGMAICNIAETPNQVLFCGIPVQDVIGMTANEVVAKFGEPEVYTEDVMDYGSDTPIKMHFGIMNENTVYGFSASPENFTFNGQSLNQNIDTMVTILGDTYIEQSNSTYDFDIAWYYEGCEISFRFPAYHYQAEGDRVIDVSVYPVG